MAERRYTTKVRAKRIALDYFKRSHPFRRWKLALSIAVPLLAAGWLAAYAVRGDQNIYNSGPVSAAHALFGTRCADCHAAATATAGRGFFVPVSDRACTVCHEGPVHHDNQAFTPTCAGCHFEHKGRDRLVELADRQCTQCHARPLVTKDGRPATVEKTIHSLASGHPEFAVDVVDGKEKKRVRLDPKTPPRDAAQIKLNHAVHLKAGLKGLEDVRALTGTRGLVERDGKAALSCTYCHRLDEHRVTIEPVAFSRHCVACHRLDADARLPGAVAPHDTPTLVHAYLRTTLTEAFEQCQALPKATPEARAKLGTQCGDLGVTGTAEAARVSAAEPSPAAEPDAPRGRRFTRPAPAEEPAPERPRSLRGRGGDAEAPAQPAPTGRSAAPTGRSAAPAASALEWTASQLPGVEKVMFRQKCGFCHVLSQAAEGLPEVAPTAIPRRWLPHSRFDHGVHRSVGCTECHGQAAKSTETTDVLLPSVSTCRECHRAGAGARTACVTCHLYHDKTKERDPDGPLTIRRLH